MSSAQLAKLAAFNRFFDDLPPTSLIDELEVPPNSEGRIRFSFGGGLNYFDTQGKPKSLPPGPKYQVTFAVNGSVLDQTAKVFGQQSDWDVPCWPNMALTLGQTVVPETSPYFAPDFPKGWPCLQASCETHQGTGKLNVTAEHFVSTVDMSTMMANPKPEDELVFFLMKTDAKTTGKIVISTI